MKKKQVTIGDNDYTLNYNVSKDNKCEVVSLTDESGTDHKDQVEADELAEHVDTINVELSPASEEESDVKAGSGDINAAASKVDAAELPTAEEED